MHVARWTFTFLLLHNLAAMASYGATVATTLSVHVEGYEDVDIEDATIVHQESLQHTSTEMGKSTNPRFRE